MRQIIDFVLLATTLIAALAGGSRAQGTPPSAEPESCFGFSFGEWSPPLDWHASGHAGSPETITSPVASGGRGWAASIHPDADGNLVLFPTWWPVGVNVDLPKRALALGDTVDGRATALVSNGSTPSSTAVRAWRVVCGASRGERSTSASSGVVAARTHFDRTLTGTWRGTSICLAAHAQCGSDSVVYRIAPAAGDADRLTLVASIIGTRGERPAADLRCRYDSSTSILSCDAPDGILRLAVRGTELGGRLTRRDGVDLRYVHVRRAEP